MNKTFVSGSFLQISRIMLYQSLYFSYFSRFCVYHANKMVQGKDVCLIQTSVEDLSLLLLCNLLSSFGSACSALLSCFKELKR